MSEKPDTNETGRNIAAEIRGKCYSEEGISCNIGYFLELSSRIEAAERRTVPATLAISTVRALLEGRSKKEKDAAVLRFARHFDENGEEQLACYVRGLAQLEPTWVPMEAEPIVDDKPQSSMRKEACESQGIGNTELRDALEAVLDECCHHLCGIPDQLAEGGQTCDWRCVAAGRCEAIDKAKAALAAPPRNCDVGSAEEQAQRFHAFCHDHRAFDTHCSNDCPFKDTPDINHCQSAWGQLPYKAEGGK